MGWGRTVGMVSPRRVSRAGGAIAWANWCRSTAGSTPGLRIAARRAASPGSSRHPRKSAACPDPLRQPGARRARANALRATRQHAGPHRRTDARRGSTPARRLVVLSVTDVRAPGGALTLLAGLTERV